MQGSDLYFNIDNHHNRSVQQNIYQVDLKNKQISQNENEDEDLLQLEQQFSQREMIKGSRAQHNYSVESCQNYFEKKMTDRRKRTFNILKKFDPKLAQEVIYKESQDCRGRHSKADRIIQQLIQASIVIQKHFRAWQARKLYNQLLFEKYEEMDRQQEIENEKLMQQWAIEQETSRLQNEIDERNRFFKYQIQQRNDAASKIQKAFQQYKKRNQGVIEPEIINVQQEQSNLQINSNEDFQDYTQVDLSLQINQNKAHRKSRVSPRSQSTNANKVNRGHLFNRIRQLQIETSNKSMLDIESDFNQTKSPLTNKFQNSQTPIDLSTQQIFKNNQMNKSFNGTCKTPQNLANMIRKSRLQQFNNQNNQGNLESSLGRKTGDIEDLKQMIRQINQKQRSKIREKSNSQRRNKNEQQFATQEIIIQQQEDQNTLKSLFTIGTSSDKIKDNINLPSGSSDSVLLLQQKLLSSGASGISQELQNLDNSISNLFDSLKQPPKLFQNNFDLTQKLQENFHQLLSQCETIEELDSLSTPLPSYNEQLDFQQEFQQQQQQQQLFQQQKLKFKNNKKRSSTRQSKSNITSLQHQEQNHNEQNKKDKQNINQNNKNIYDQFLRDESIQDKTHLNNNVNLQQNESDIDNNYHQQSIMDIIKNSQITNQQFINNDDTLSEDDFMNINNTNELLLLGGNNSNNNSKDRQLNENDFPMTQLIKERTIHYHNDSTQDFISNKQYHQEYIINQQKQEYQLNERYNYFLQLLNVYNDKVNYLGQLQQNRDDLVNRIMFHQNIFTNLNHMVKNANPQQKNMAQQKQTVQKQQQQQQQNQKKQNNQKYQINTNNDQFLNQNKINNKNFNDIGKQGNISSKQQQQQEQQQIKKQFLRQLQ